MPSARNTNANQLATAALFYGAYAFDFDTASYRQFGDGRYGFGLDRMRWHTRCFLGAERFTTTRLAAPLRAPLSGFRKLPPIYLNAAGLDSLRDDSLLLASRLAEAGVGFRLDVIPGVVHGFMQMSRELPAAVAAQAKAAAWLGELVAGAV